MKDSSPTSSHNLDLSLTTATICPSPSDISSPGLQSSIFLPADSIYNAVANEEEQGDFSNKLYLMPNSTRENILNMFKEFDAPKSSRSSHQNGEFQVQHNSSSSILEDNNSSTANLTVKDLSLKKNSMIIKEVPVDTTSSSPKSSFLSEDPKGTNEKTTLDEQNEGQNSEQQQINDIFSSVKIDNRSNSKILSLITTRKAQFKDVSYQGSMSSSYPKWTGFNLPEQLAAAIFTGYIVTPSGDQLQMTEILKKQIQHFLMIAHVLEFYLNRFSYHVQQLDAYAEMKNWDKPGLIIQFNLQMMEIRKRAREMQKIVDKQWTKKNKLLVAKNLRVNWMYEQERNFYKLEFIHPRKMTPDKLLTAIYQVMLNYNAFLLELMMLNEYYKPSLLEKMLMSFSYKTRKKEFLVGLGTRFISAVYLFEFNVFGSEFDLLLMDIDAARSALTDEISKEFNST